jgi:hypothetical protein
VLHAWGREENECGETFVPNGDQHVLKECRGGKVDERGPAQCAPGIREIGEGGWGADVRAPWHSNGRR